MHFRLSKIALVAAAALFLAIVVANNAFFDYPSNYAFVQHVLGMDSLFSGEAQAWRAFRDSTPEDNSYWVYHAFYASIILWEAAAGVGCAVGAWQLWRARHETAAAFHRAKKWAVYGLSLSLLQWFVAFITVGAEWFLMWQSKTWNGQDAAFRMFACLGIMLVYLSLKEDELETGSER